MTTHNASQIASLERHIGAAQARIKTIGAKATNEDRMLSPADHRHITAATAEIQSMSLRLQEAKAIGATFGPRAY